MLEPIDEWSDSFRTCLGACNDAIPRPEQELIASVEDAFA